MLHVGDVFRDCTGHTYQWSIVPGCQNFTVGVGVLYVLVACGVWEGWHVLREQGGSRTINADLSDAARWELVKAGMGAEPTSDASNWRTDARRRVESVARETWREQMQLHLLDLEDDNK